MDDPIILAPGAPGPAQPPAPAESPATRLEPRVAQVEPVAKVRATEHDKLGFRFGAIEQRLRRVEESVAELSTGDPRHLV